MKAKLLIIGIVFFMLASTAAVIAAVLKTLPGTVTITASPTISVEVYSDPQMTQVMSSVDFGNLQAGATSSPITLYIKNTGTTTLDVSVVQTENILWGSVSIIPATPFLLSPGSSGSVTLQVSTFVGTSGPKTLTFTVNG